MGPPPPLGDMGGGRGLNTPLIAPVSSVDDNGIHWMHARHQQHDGQHAQCLDGASGAQRDISPVLSPGPVVFQGLGMDPGMGDVTDNWLID